MIIVQHKVLSFAYYGKEDNVDDSSVNAVISILTTFMC